MFNNQRLFNLMTIVLLLIPNLPAFAQSTANPSAIFGRELKEVFFKPPSDDKKPDHTADAGSRHPIPCLQKVNSSILINSSSSQNTFIPLIPKSNFGLTVSEKPKLWVYVPETSARQLILSIREKGSIHHSKTFIPIVGNSSIISLQPNQDSLPLEIGKNYKLSVVLVCGKKPGPNDPARDVWVRRIESFEPLNHKSALERAAWYGRKGIWYDSLNSLIEARQSQLHNQDLKIIWTDFLDSEGLKAIANEPVQF